MDIKSMTELMQMTMLKKLIVDESTTASSNGSAQNSEMFKMLLETMISSALEADPSLGSSNDVMSQLQGVNNSIDTSGQQMVGALNNESEQSSLQSTTSSEKIEYAIKAAASKYGVDEDFIRAMVKQESGFRPQAVSSAGAMGLMQLMPKTAQSLGVDNPFNELENIDGGTRYIRQLMDSFKGNKELALSAYNGGIGRMNKRGVDTVEEIDKMPKETQNYVNKVMKNYENYKK